MANGFRQVSAETERVRAMKELNSDDNLVYSEVIAENSDSMNASLKDINEYSEVIAENSDDVRKELTDINSNFEKNNKLTDETKSKFSTFADQLKNNILVDTTRQLAPIPDNTTPIVEILPQEEQKVNDSEVADLLTEIKDQLVVPNKPKFNLPTPPTDDDFKDEKKEKKPSPLKDKTMAFMGKGFKQMSSSLMGVLKTINGVTAILTAWRKIQMTMLVAGLLALVAVADYVKYSWESWKEYFTTAWNDLKESLSTMWEGLKESMVDLKDRFMEKVDLLKQAFSDLGSRIGSMVDYFLNGAFTDDIKNAISSVWDTVKVMFNDLMSNLKQSLGKLLEAVGFKEAGQTMQAEAITEKNVNSGYRATEEEMDVVAKVKRRQLDETGFEDASPEDKAKYFNAKGKLKSVEEIKKVEKVMQDIESLKRESNNITSSEQQKQFDEKKTKLVRDISTTISNPTEAKQLQSEISELGVKKEKDQPIDNAEVKHQNLDESKANTIESTEARISNQKDQQQQAQVNSAIQVNNSQQKIIKTGPATTNRPTPGFSNAI